MLFLYFKISVMYNTLLTTLEEGIFTITINRAKKLNALNREVMDELAAAVREVYHNEEIRSVLLTGAGEKAFVAGADISEFLEISPENGTVLAENGQRMFSRIETCPKPFIAAVNGFALGGGCELAMACHFRIAADTAAFGQPEVNLGLIPGYGGTQRLPRLIGRGRALEFMMTGEIITADRALEMGLVNHVVTAGELITFSRELLLKIQRKAPLAVSRVITCVNAAFQPGTDGFETERREFGRCFGTDDMKEGAEAFLEKRRPAFKGK